MRSVIVSAAAALLLVPAAAFSQAAPQAPGSPAAQVIQAAAELALARKCGWSNPLSLIAMEGTLDIARSDLLAKAPADVKTRFDAAVTSARTRGEGMDCATAQGGRAAIERKATGQFDQMLVQADFFSDTPTNTIIGLNDAASKEVGLAASWMEAAVPEAKLKAFRTPLYDRARKVALAICADRNAQGKPLDVYMCKDAPAIDPSVLPTAKVAAKSYKAFGEALAADQRTRRAALERQVGKLSAFYKSSARPSDCRAGDAVYDYGSAPKRIHGATPAELSLVRQLRLGSPGTAAPALYLRMQDMDRKLPPNPERVELTLIPSESALGDELARYAVAGVFQFSPEVLAQAKQKGRTDAQIAAQKKQSADDTFTNFVSEGAMRALSGGSKSASWWRCPSAA